jgi:hypothetical protein
MQVQAQAIDMLAVELVIAQQQDQTPLDNAASRAIA